jgi:two-component system, chemotaxis family, protein-glutamate methylesterase/glutaminase
LTRLAHEPIHEPERETMSDQDLTENAADRMDYLGVDPNMPGDPSTFTCPDCHGTLWEIEEGNLLRYRCRVGHAFSSEALMNAQAEDVEGALYAALRTLEEHMSLTNRMLLRAKERGHNLIVQRLEETMRDLDGRLKLIRRVLENGSTYAYPRAEPHA